MSERDDMPELPVVAWAAFTPEGNLRLWSAKKTDVSAVSALHGELTGLVTRDAAQQYAEQRVREEREAIINSIPGGSIVDPQWVCDMIRGRSA